MQERNLGLIIFLHTIRFLFRRFNFDFDSVQDLRTISDIELRFMKTISWTSQKSSTILSYFHNKQKRVYIPQKCKLYFKLKLLRVFSACHFDRGAIRNFKDFVFSIPLRKQVSHSIQLSHFNLSKFAHCLKLFLFFLFYQSAK